MKNKIQQYINAIKKAFITPLNFKIKNNMPFKKKVQIKSKEDILEFNENPIESIQNAIEEKNEQDRVQKEEEENIQIKKSIDEKVEKKIIYRDVKKEKQDKAKKSIEDVLQKGKNIQWKLLNNNHIQGFVKEQLVFEIKKGLTIFNLYIKNDTLLNEKAKKGYYSCSTNIEKLKERSEKFLK